MSAPPAEDRRYCPNCHYPLPPGGSFCSNCGQKYTDGRITLGTLLHEFFDSVLNIDSKIFRTLGALFIPGKLTVEYFKGRHKRYLPPLRLFFVSAIIFFAVFGYMLNQGLEPFMQELEDSQLEDIYMAEFMDQIDSARIDIEARYAGRPEVKIALDSLEAHLNDTRGDSTSYGYLQFQKDWSFEGKQLQIEKRDLQMKPAELCDKYGVQGFLNRLQVQQTLKLNREGKSYLQFAIGNFIWMVLLMMPVLALILKILYIRRKRYYVEHLVFAFHYHAFAFLLIATGILLGSDFIIKVDGEGINNGVFDGNAVTGIVNVILFLYLYKAMRRMYGQGRFKTFLKFSILNFFYVLVFILFLLLFFVATALTF